MLSCLGVAFLNGRSALSLISGAGKVFQPARSKIGVVTTPVTRCGRRVSFVRSYGHRTGSVRPLSVVASVARPSNLLRADFRPCSDTGILGGSAFRSVLRRGSDARRC